MSERKIETHEDLQLWRLSEINKLINQYNSTPDHFTKTKNGLLEGIKLLSEFSDVEIKVKEISEKIDELLER